MLIVVPVILVIFILNQRLPSQDLYATSERSDNAVLVISVIDGDTFDLENSARIRLWGVDAPEARQKCYSKSGFWMCGEHATAFLTEKILGKKVECVAVAKDNNGRDISKCTIDEMDLSKMLVTSGWSVDWPKYSKGFYAADEEAARAASLGIHSLN